MLHLCPSLCMPPGYNIAYIPEKILFAISTNDATYTTVVTVFKLLQAEWYTE